MPEGTEEAYKADEYWKELFDIAGGELSGTCGENLTWTLALADSTLTISGTGEMAYGWRNGCRSAIKTVIIEDGVTTIRESAFSSCYALTQVTIPDGVTYIGEYAFDNCYALTQVTIPDGVTYIGERAFSYCTELSTLTIHSTTPPNLSIYGVFDGVDKSIPVYVPAASVEAYKAAPGWNVFTNILPIEEEDEDIKDDTALDQITLPESLRIVGGAIYNPQGLRVAVYDLQGRAVYSGTETTVRLPRGIYIVRCGNATMKVLL